MANAAITVDLNARIAQFETEMKRATGTLDKFGKNSAAIGGLLRTAFSGAAVVGLVSFAKSGIDAADALGKLSARTGVAVKDLAALQLSADSADTSLEDVGKAMLRLKVSVGDASTGNKALGESLARLGVVSKDPMEQLYQLADAVRDGGGSALVASDLNKVLGKSYANLLPLLQQGGDALRDSAKASEDFADAMARLSPDAEKFNDQLDAIKQNAAGVAASILSELVPSFNEWIAVGREVVETGTLLDKVRFFGLGNASDDMVNRVRVMSSTTAGWANNLKKSALALNTIKIPDDGEPDKKKPKTGVSKSDPQGAFIDKLRQEASTLGLTGEALQRYEAAKLKLTGSNKKLADSYIAQIAAFKDQQEAAKANNDAFDEAIKKQDELDSALEGSIKSVREWIAEQEFEVSLIGLSNSERETAIQLRALEVAGIDTQTEAYKKLAEQVAAANADKRGISILSGTQTEKTKEFMSDVDSLNKLFFDGKIGAQQYAEGIDLITASTKDAKVEMDEFAKNAAESIQKSMADFLFDPFDKGLDGMLEGFGKMLQRMIADAAAAQIARELFGGLSDSGKTEGSGAIGSVLSLVGGLFASANGNAFANGAGLSAYSGSIVSNPTVFPFASGAGLMGEAGPEVILPLKRGANGKLGVQSGGSGANITVNVNGSNNAPDVRRAAAQGAREAMGMMSAAKRYA